MKTIAMYLPQFHEIPENDKWWGKGFTEWTAVRNAERLFKDHDQPRVPLNEYYYNLLDKSTMAQQAKWMKDYQIDGICMYHYYFANGRKILEKPAENLLRWKEIDMPFCFSWANDPWTRTWSRISGNSWADKYEKPTDCAEVLLKQDYGREDEWKKHLDYLAIFWKDDRYIKIDNKPVFIIHSPETIPCLYAMLENWRKNITEYGFKDIFIIAVENNYEIKGADASLYLAPHKFWDLRGAKRENGVRRPDYDKMWKKMLEVRIPSNRKIYLSAVADCDDTPRRGVNGTSMDGFSIDKFQGYMTDLYRKSAALNNEFVFINAWNEWGEGMYLEPDEKHGYAVLNAVKNAYRSFSDNSGGAIEKKDYDGSNVVENREGANTKLYRLNAMCFEKWLTLKETGKQISDYLKKYGIEKVAVYGFGSIGHHLVGELSEENIEVAYIIDQSYQKHAPECDIISPDNDLPAVDAIIITVLWDFENIYDSIRKKCDYPIISVMEMVQ